MSLNELPRYRRSGLIVGGGITPPPSFVGLLDTYPNAAIAYSVRRLSNSYAGALIRVRRSSDNLEQDIGYDSNNELDQVELLTFVGVNDGFVTVWYDQSGNNNNTIQATASNQLQIVSSGVVVTENGKAAMEGFGGTDFMNITNPVAMTETHSIFATQRFSQRGVELIAAGANTYGIYQDASVTYYALDGAPPAVSFVSFGGTVSLNQQILSIFSQGLNISLYENGAQIGTTKSFVSRAPVSISNISGDGSPFYFTGKQQEMVIYISNQASNKTGIEENVNNYFNIYP